MIKIIATLGVAFIFNSVQAQSAKSTSLETRLEKNNHGRTVSTAAKQTYARSEKGKFISQVARFKTDKPGSTRLAKAPAERLTKTQSIKPKIKQVKQAGYPVRPPQRVVIHKATPNYREVRVNRPTPVRRQLGHARFSQVGRG